MTDFDSSEQNKTAEEAVSSEPVEPRAEPVDRPGEETEADPGAGETTDSGAAQAGQPDQQQEAAGSEPEESVAAAPSKPMRAAPDEAPAAVEEAPSDVAEAPAETERTLDDAGEAPAAVEEASTPAASVAEEEPTETSTGEGSEESEPPKEPVTPARDEAPAAVEEASTPAAAVAEEQPAEIPTAEESGPAAEQPAEAPEAAIEEAEPQAAPSEEAEGEPEQEPAAEQPEAAEAEAEEQQEEPRAVGEEAAALAVAAERSEDEGSDVQQEAAETEVESQPSNGEGGEPAPAKPPKVTPVPGMDWYIIHTYSSFENKVRESLHTRAEAFGFSDRIGEILIPTEDVIEMRGGKKVRSKRLLYPGYVLLQLNMDDELWHVVKNTPRVTGFVGGGHTPTPLTVDEVNQILYRQTVSAEKPRPKLTFQKSDRVKIVDGPFTNFTGTVEEVNPDRNTLKVMVTIFGRGTPVELEHFQVEKERI